MKKIKFIESKLCDMSPDFLINIMTDFGFIVVNDEDVNGDIITLSKEKLIQRLLSEDLDFSSDNFYDPCGVSDCTFREHVLMRWSDYWMFFDA